MIFKLQWAKKWYLGVTAAAVIYAGLWFITESWGVPEIRQVTVEVIRQPALDRDGSEDSGGPASGPFYRCSAGAYAPLVIRADYQWQNGVQSGEGWMLYFWCFGHTFRLHQTAA